MKKFGVVLRGKINHIAQLVYLNCQGWKKIKLDQNNVLNRQGPSKILRLLQFLFNP